MFLGKGIFIEGFSDGKKPGDKLAPEYIRDSKTYNTTATIRNKHKGGASIPNTDDNTGLRTPGESIIRETDESFFEKISKNFYIRNPDKNIRITVNANTYNTYRVIIVDRIRA